MLAAVEKGRKVEEELGVGLVALNAAVRGRRRMVFRICMETQSLSLSTVTSSKFSITSEDLSQELHHHAEGAALQFMADGIAYTGTVVHDHDHGHGEEHGHDEGHEVGEDSDDGPEAPATQEETSDAVKPEANTEAAETPVH